MAKRLPFRIILKHRGVARKFLSLITAKDNSIFIHQNRPDDQGWKIPGYSSAADTSGRMRIDFKNYDEPSFEMQKLTIHQSGFIHITNKKGERLRDGIRGPAFSDMELPYDICVIVPCNPELLPVYSTDKAHVAELELLEAILGRPPQPGLAVF